MPSSARRVDDALDRIEKERMPTPPGGRSIRVGLVGRGITASLTPIMHEQEGLRLGLGYRYDLIDFDRLELADEDLQALLDSVTARGFRGVNVTFPFKQAIISFLDDLSGSAAAVGAVNTVVFEADKRWGHNTDCFGFAQAVRQGLSDVTTEHVVQVGAGGAGAAVAQALANLGARRIDIVDVEEQKAAALARHVGEANGIAVRSATVDQLPTLIRQASGVVNATPVGMSKVPGLPFDTDALAARHWVADIIYFPRETELIRKARALGCQVLPGGGMAVHQAVRAFELFTGLAADSGAMSRTFADYA